MSDDRNNFDDFLNSLRRPATPLELIEDLERHKRQSVQRGFAIAIAAAARLVDEAGHAELAVRLRKLRLVRKAA